MSTLRTSLLILLAALGLLATGCEKKPAEPAEILALVAQLITETGDAS